MTDELDMRRGWSVVVYFPPEAPAQLVDNFIDELADKVYSMEYDGAWDPFMYANAGDISGAGLELTEEES